jgi:cyclophilin family peptidyl-prolyl cis-trans isomerase
MRLRLLPLLSLLLLPLLAGCGGGGSSSTTTTDAAGCIPMSRPSGAARTAPKPTAALDPAKTYDVTLDTNCGSFTFQLDQKQSPHAAAAFVELVQRGYYDKTIFHRIVPGFVIQGGDPTGTGEGGPGFTTIDKPPAHAEYTHGVVAMAKTSVQPPGAAGSQFFVVTTANTGLPPDYAIVGKVVKGLDVVDRIGKLGNANDPNGTPTEVVEIEKATVTSS